MGGIFALLHAGTHRDDRVRNIVTIGAPINFKKMRAAYVASRIGACSPLGSMCARTKRSRSEAVDLMP